MKASWRTADRHGRIQTLSTVDAIIVNYLTPDLVAECVACISHVDIACWVMDNSCDMPEFAIDATVVSPGENLYFAKATNILVGLGTAEYILLLNPDVMVTSDTVQAMCGVLSAREELWGVAPKLLNSDGTVQKYLHDIPRSRDLILDLMPLPELVKKPWLRKYYCSNFDFTVSQDARQPPAACLLLRRSDFADAQIFNEDLRLFFNDADLALRQNKDRSCWYEATVSAEHIRGASLQRAGRVNPGSIRREYLQAAVVFATLNNLPGLLPLKALVFIHLKSICVAVAIQKYLRKRGLRT